MAPVGRRIGRREAFRRAAIGYPSGVRQPAARHARPVRALLVVLGTVALGLGALGLVLPVLPTTPFVLLAAACYLRASDRLHRRLVTSRTFGPTIVAWQEHGAIAPRAKVLAIALIVLTFGLTIGFAVEPPVLRGALAALGLVLIVWLARRPSPPEGIIAQRRVVP
jgi:uncharacterized membrane protein YbaN (DUF454 family)